MKVREIMTFDPMCCTPDDFLVDAAKIMVEYDCGEVPVIESVVGKNLVGVITDRDIVCRTLGKNLNPFEMKVSDCMTHPAISINEDDDIEECLRTMQQSQIRRIPVITVDERICGIIALADLAKYISEQTSGEVLREVSTETGGAAGAALESSLKRSQQ